MKKEITYNHNLVKGDVIEIYAKTIANLGPLNFIKEKNFSIDTKSNSNKGNIGYTLMSYTGGHTAYIARQIMDCADNVDNVRMERGNLFYDNPSRKITLEAIDKQTKVTLEGSNRAIKTMQKTIDEMFC